MLTPDTATECGLVHVLDLCPSLIVDLSYARPNNMFGARLYECNEAWLLRETAVKLADAAALASERRHRIIVLDAYRPLAVQRHMWSIHPDETFVAPPERGSFHNRGAAVDVWLADEHGVRLPMPSDFDEFSHRASHEYSGGDVLALRNREVLKTCMESAGFTAYRAEWWHYNDTEQLERPLLNRSLCALHEEHEASFAP